MFIDFEVIFQSTRYVNINKPRVLNLQSTHPITMTSDFG